VEENEKKKAITKGSSHQNKLPKILRKKLLYSKWVSEWFAVALSHCEVVRGSLGLCWTIV